MKTEGKWDWRVLLLTRPKTELPDVGGIISLLGLLANRCDKNFRIVFLNRRECVVTYQEPTDNSTFQRELIALAKAANLELRPVDASSIDWPKPTEVKQLIGPRYLEADVLATLRGLFGATQVALDSRGGRILRVLVAWNAELTEMATSFQEAKLVKHGWNVFTPGLRLRRMGGGGISFADLAGSFILEQHQPKTSSVAVRVGAAENGSEVFVDAGPGHVLILGPMNSINGPRVANQLALKAVEAGQIVVVVQPQEGGLGCLEQVLTGNQEKVLNTRESGRRTSSWQSQVLEPGLSVLQGHHGGGALETIQETLTSLLNLVKMEARQRAGWPGMLIVIRDFIPPSQESNGRTIPGYRHPIYQLLADMVSTEDSIRVVLCTRPKVAFGVEQLQGVGGNFPTILRLRTETTGFERGEGYAVDKFENIDYYEWLHEPGAMGRTLVHTPREGWKKVTLDIPEVETVNEDMMEPRIRVLTEDEVLQTHTWPARERPVTAHEPPVPSWTPPSSASMGDVEAKLRALRWLPRTEEEREAEEMAAAAKMAREEKAEEPLCKTPLTAGERKKLKPIIDLVDRLVEGGIESPDLVRILRAGVSRQRFEDFLDGTLSEEGLRAPANAAQQKLEEQARDLKAADTAELEKVLGIKLL